MRIRKKLSILVSICLLLTAVMAPMVSAKDIPAPDKITASELDIFEKLIYSYAEAINTCNIDEYISLFTEENQALMKNFINLSGSSNFFQEGNVRITNLKKLTAPTGLRAASLSEDEVSKYDGVVVYYVESIISDEIGSAQVREERSPEGYTYQAFVFAAEGVCWKIYRISTPDYLTILSSSEGFDTGYEKAAFDGQEEEKELLLNNGRKQPVSPNSIMTTSAVPSADPTTIAVYFTDPSNISAHGSTSASLDWESYLKNVIPNEWTVSWYDLHPAYVEAGAMASKMYGWWYIIHPKWNYAPFFSDVKDSDEDQVYIWNSYANLWYYQHCVDGPLQYVRNVAMCSDSGDMFEVHYHSTNGTQYSGTMSASGALSLAQQGYSCFQILKYYFAYSSYIGYSHSILFYGYV